MSSSILPSTSADSRVSSTGNIGGGVGGRYKISSSKDAHVTTTSSSRHTSPVIIELGSSSIQVGIAGEAQPRCIMPSTSIIINGNEGKGSGNGSTSSSFITTPPLPCSSMILQNQTISSINQEENLTTTHTNNEYNKYCMYHQHLSPFFHNLFTYRLHLKPKSRRVIILMPTHYPTIYREVIQKILLDELKIPALKFINGSGLYTTIPYALGKNVGLVIDVGSLECQMGAFFNRHLLNDTIITVPIGKKVLIQRICDDYLNFRRNRRIEGGVSKNDTVLKNIDDDDNYDDLNRDDVNSIIEDILIVMKQTPSSSLSSSGVQYYNKDCMAKTHYEYLKQMTQEYIEDFYFNIDNAHSLINAFLTTLLKCPLDLRLDLVRNVCFIGDGVTTSSSSCVVPNLEYRFLSSIQSLFELKSTTTSSGENHGDTLTRSSDENRMIGGGNCRIKEKRYQKFQVLAMSLMEKGPLSLIHPLPYHPSCISWVGGSVYGSLNLPNDEWIHIDNTLPQITITMQ